MIKCIIIEDELPAQKIIQNFIHKIPDVECVATFQTALGANDFLKNNTVDIAFLDINLPDISGFDFIKTVQNPPKIIMTTAYPEYALDSFELETIVDYLVKPFSFDRFLKSIKKVKNQLNTKISEEDTSTFINVDKALHKIYFDDILFLESDRNYITIVTENKKFVLVESLRKWKNKLPKPFVQVQKSFIVNTDKIEKILGNVICISDYKIPIGRSYKVAFLDSVGN